MSLLQWEQRVSHREPECVLCLRREQTPGYNPTKRVQARKSWSARESPQVYGAAGTSVNVHGNYWTHRMPTD